MNCIYNVFFFLFFCITLKTKKKNKFAGEPGQKQKKKNLLKKRSITLK